jgi:hypothetical protein
MSIHKSAWKRQKHDPMTPYSELPLLCLIHEIRMFNLCLEYRQDWFRYSMYINDIRVY